MMVMARRIDEMLVAVRTVMLVMMMVLMAVRAVVRMVMMFRIKGYVVINRLNSQLGNGFADEGIAFQLQRGHGVLKGIEGHAGLQKGTPACRSMPVNILPLIPEKQSRYKVFMYNLLPAANGHSKSSYFNSLFIMSTAASSRDKPMTEPMP